MSFQVHCAMGPGPSSCKRCFFLIFFFSLWSWVAQPLGVGYTHIICSVFQCCDLCWWGLCALRHGIQILKEAILACHPARSTEWLDCHPKSCELWRSRTGPIPSDLHGNHQALISEFHVLKNKKGADFYHWLMKLYFAKCFDEHTAEM